MFHRIAHMFGSNRGEVVSVVWHNNVWIAFRCVTCGQVNHAHRADHKPYLIDDCPPSMAFQP